jgi:hypothetical protein
MDQVFQAVRDDVQCRRIDRSFIAILGLETFGGVCRKPNPS